MSQIFNYHQNHRLLLIIATIIATATLITLEGATANETEKIQHEIIEEIEQNFIQVTNSKGLRFGRQIPGKGEELPAGSGEGAPNKIEEVEETTTMKARGLLAEEKDETTTLGKPVEKITTTTDDAIKPENMTILFSYIHTFVPSFDEDTTTTTTTAVTTPTETTTVATVKEETKTSKITTIPVTNPPPPQTSQKTQQIPSVPDDKVGTTIGTEVITQSSENEPPGAVEERLIRSEISDHLAFYLGLGAACLVGAWLVLGPIICLIIHARRKWRERQYAGAISPNQGNSGGGWFSRWNRGGQSQRPLVNANRAPSPPRLGSNNVEAGDASASIPLRDREMPPPPIITISQAYPAPAMTTFSATTTDETQQQEPLIGRSTLRTDI